ncbi:glutathione S-transferase [Colletotrichum graminicola]|uniref:Glutathione S-transferase n=1 Tax=Colletotrichum graminicola (strain M1.001 / M2 / FGSC 10212) TaxID=645133 RepID=E3QE80_COLGM|nr:glutathione S-transferase [Colletotrichum graminicola M1.001]EFQ29168.1 glutathione S-transferase [Colletotrichum graminicola M1.001]WDK20308.1 glutathione S-transferase [Colletotrichum graminicola]
MSFSGEEKKIVLYHYSASPYARRIVWYLALRGIPYVQCMQPPVLPRPDVEKLGIVHRRIPILAIGRDIYYDTRLMLRKLEQLYPSRPRLGAAVPEEVAVERLLEALVIDGGVFSNAVNVLPTDLPFLRDPKSNFLKDRAEYLGRKHSAETIQRARPTAVNEIRRTMELLETTLLADGRDWVLRTDGPGLADIEAVWLPHWLTRIPGALPQEQISAERFPKVFAWIGRFQKAVSAATKAAPEVATVSGDEAAGIVVSSPYNEAAGCVDAADALVAAEGLAAGDDVILWPADTGASHKDTGKLVSLDKDEVVIEVQGPKGPARVHAPRHGFRVEKLDRFKERRASAKL